MQIVKKMFGNPESGFLNADDAPFSIGPNQWVNAENIRTGSTDKGQINTVESIGSTELISTPQPSVTFMEIGSAEDTENGVLCTFYYNVHGPWHKIEAYLSSQNRIYTVLLSSQVTGGLNFSKNFPIHSARIVNGYLYWVEGTNNQPRKVNIFSGIKLNDPSFDTDEVAYVAPVSPFELTIIKPPPEYTPNITKDTDAGFVNNFIANDSFEFAYQFVFYDNERTVVGEYSRASRLNAVDQAENYISVVMDSRQTIPNSVRIVNLIVRNSNTNFANIIKSWDKNNSDDAQEIVLQNSGSAQLTFDFYNNITGEAIPNAPINLVLKAFDSVPIYAWALEVAKNRLFLGDTVAGYDTPLSTSMILSLTSVEIDGSSIFKNLVGVAQGYLVPDKSYSAWYFYLTEVVPQGYYVITSTEQTANSSVPPTPPPAPTTVAFSGLTFVGATQTDVKNYIKALLGNPSILVFDVFTFTANSCEITGIGVTTVDVFKGGSQYKAGTVFYDFAMRRCGVVTNDGLIFETPTRDYEYSSGTGGAVFTLSNDNALDEIPEWAYYYSVVRTLNLTTRNFIQSFDNAVKYASKDADGNYVFTATTYSTTSVGIAINTTALVQSGLGYAFNQGDLAVIITEANDVYRLPVVDQSANYIIVKPQDIGDTTSLKIVYEIFTPYQTSDQEPYYNMGEVYEVLNPGTDARSYGTISDVLIPDAYTLTRNFDSDTYFAEGMSPNDLFYQRWDTDAGKPNFITTLGQSSKISFFSWSNTFIPGTSVNGLSTFDALDERNVPEDCGAIQKLILTSKVQGEGTVMLAVCTAETNSIYLGEQQIYDVAGQSQYLAGTSNVVGTINTLQGSYGTRHPESVVAFRGLVFWWDDVSEKIIQYSVNGLFEISNYKMTRFWKQFSTQFNSMTREEIEALGGRPFVFSAVDPRHNELLFSIPKLLATPPMGYLPDDPARVYPFDIWDGQSKTIVYELKLGEGFPRWKGSYAFSPEGFSVLNNELYSYKNGHLYKHNSLSSENQFYGVQYKSRIMFVINELPSQPKVAQSISVEGNLVPSYTYLYNNYPYQQCTDLEDIDYRDFEGVRYATFYRNKLVPTADGYTTNGLLTNSDRLRGASLFCMLEFSPTTTPLELKFVNIGFTPSVGHKV